MQNKEEKIITLVKKRPTEEVINIQTLIELIKSGEAKHYIGYEISGLIHLGTYSTLIKVKDLEELNINTNIFLADYHSYINKKFGGDIEFIREVATEYFQKQIKKIVKANTILASNIYNETYWEEVLKISSKTTLSRVKRTITIMGREAGESIPLSWLIYPIMQVEDIFYLNINIAQAGMDQRKAHMLALEIGKKMNKKLSFIHTHILPSLSQKKEKMSKSKPNTAIFIHDNEEEIEKKIISAYCPQKEVEGNPVIEILSNIIYRENNEKIRIERPSKYGGDWEGTFSEFLEEYKKGFIHPLDVKKHTAEKIKELLKPFRELKENEEELINLIKEKQKKK